MRPADAFKKLLAKALSYPGTFKDHPWDHTVVKCSNKKIFVFVDNDDGFSITCKLPASSDAAITMFSWAEPTGYGMGEKGWVTSSFGKKDDVPFELFLEWLEESFHAIAPKRDLKLLPPAPAAASPARKKKRA